MLEYSAVRLAVRFFFLFSLLNRLIDFRKFAMGITVGIGWEFVFGGGMGICSVFVLVSYSSYG